MAETCNAQEITSLPEHMESLGRKKFFSIGIRYDLPERSTMTGWKI